MTQFWGSDRNKLHPKQSAPWRKQQSTRLQSKYYRVLCGITIGENYNIKLYTCGTKIVNKFNCAQKNCS